MLLILLNNHFVFRIDITHLILTECLDVFAYLLRYFYPYFHYILFSRHIYTSQHIVNL